MGKTTRKLRQKLFLLTGCGDFGEYEDGTIGPCIDCYCNTPDLYDRCHAFQNMIDSYNKMKNAESKTIGEIRGEVLSKVISRIDAVNNEPNELELTFSHFYSPDTFIEDEEKYVGVLCECTPNGAWYYPPKKPGFYKAVCPRCGHSNYICTAKKRGEQNNGRENF